MRARTAKIALFLSALVFTSYTFAVGPATHAYIADQLNHKGYLLKLNQRYGAMAADVFYYSQLPPSLQNLLSLATHCDDGGFMKVWDKATTTTEKALAYGFVSHNNLWGVDYYAHQPFCSAGTATGYVVSQANALVTDPELTNRQDFKDVAAALAEHPELGSEMAQDVIEAAVDILLKDTDAHIGDKVVASATLRSPKFVQLLINAYAAYFWSLGYFGTPDEAATAILSAEFSFRTAMTLYGSALQQDEATAKQLISDFLVIHFATLLQANGITFSLDELASLTKAALDVAMRLCRSTPPDFDEIINGVQKGLSDNSIEY